jgi:hypothetical protein
MSLSRLADPMREQRLRFSEIAGARAFAEPLAEQQLVDVSDAFPKQ